MASRRKAPRQQSSSSGATQSQPGGDGGPNRQLLQQYAEGKKFKVKYLGSQDIEDYRNKRETSAIMADLKRRSSKAPKPKALISLFAKELIVMDEKSKTVTMKVPVSKVKFVCHNKTDTSLFGVILATDRVTSESQRLHRMFCYQADPKIAAAFVRSVNELFQILAEVMRERRARQEARNSGSDRSRDQATGGGGASATGGGASSGGGGASGGGSGGQSSDGQVAGATGGDPMSDDERYEPVPLGFGIEAPPPSYRAAISKKNETIFKKPDDVQTTVTTRLPPPPPASRAKKPAPPPPANRLSAPPTSTGRLNPPPTSQSRRTAAQPAPPTTTTSSQQAATPTARNGTPTSATSLPLPQVPVASVSTSGATGGAIFNIGTTDEEDTGLNPSTEGNIYDVPTNNQPVPSSQPAAPNQSAQVQREAVWQEWQALESELQTIAQDLGFDMDSNNSTGAAVGGASAAAVVPPIADLNIPPPNIASEASFSEDPFADDFFQTSFSSPSASLSSQSAWPGANTSASGEQVVDPFSSGASFEVAWGTAEDTSSTSQAAGVSVSSSEAADPFQEGLATPTGSSGGIQAAAAHDPFQDTAATSPPVSFDFAGFSAGESPWNESSSIVTTTTSSITQAIPSASFDEGFGSDWSAFGGGTGMNIATSNAAVPQTPVEQDSQQEPTTTLSGPPPQVAIPRKAEATTAQGVTAASNTVMAPEDSFGASPAAVPPPPLSKRDSAILKPPPVSPTRRADAISDRNQSVSSCSRPRPSPAKDQTQAPAVVAAATAADLQVVLNRPPKSRSSPGQTRAYSDEIEPQPEEITIPSPDFGAEMEVASTSFDAMFDAPNNNQESGEVSLASSVGTSDPFLQSGLPPMAGPPGGETPSSASDFFHLATYTTTSAQAGAVASHSFPDVQPPSTSQADIIGELFQDSLPPSSATSANQASFGDPFQGGTSSQASTQSATDQLSLGNPFQAVSPQHVPAAPSTTQQTPPPVASDPFQDGFSPVAVSGSVSKTTSDDPFGGGGGMVGPSTGSRDDPFQSSIQPPTTSTTKSQVGTAAVKSAPESGLESGRGGGGGDRSGFGDMWSSKKQESTTSGDNWSAAFGGDGSMKSAAKKEEPKESANSSFSGFGDNWSGFPDQRKTNVVSTSASKPVAESSISTATSASQGNTESSWNAFGQDSFPTPSPAKIAAAAIASSTAQSQPQVQQKQTKPTAATAGLLPPPSTSSKTNRPSGRVGGSPLSSQSRPRTRPSGERAPPGGGSSGLLNPPTTQKVQSGSARDQAQTGSGSGATAKELASNPLNKSEVSTKKSGSYLDELSSLSGPSQHQQQPQFSPMNMSYPGAGGGSGMGGPLFQQQQQQQQPGGWGSPPGPNSVQSPPASSQQPMQVPPQQHQGFQLYGGPQGPPPGVQQGMTPQQQQQQQFVQQQQAMFMQQQQQAMQQMQQGPPGTMQQGPPGSMRQQGPPGTMQQGPPGSMRQQGPPGAMQQGPPGTMQQGPPGSMRQQGPPGTMQQGPPGAMQQGPPGSMQGGGYTTNMQQMPPGQVAMQQGAMGGGVQQFSPGGPQQMIRPPGQGAQVPPGPPQFSSPQQQQQYFYQQQQIQQQQNPNAFVPAGQPGNPLTPGNASMGGGQFAGANLSTSHLNASGFSSPPYAVGSSTPQSGGTPGSAAAPAPADLPPPTVEYRPSVNDGRPDPFASLVTGALTPSKDGKVKGVDAEKLKAAFIKQPSPNRFPSPGPTYNNPQGGWV